MRSTVVVMVVAALVAVAVPAMAPAADKTAKGAAVGAGIGLIAGGGKGAAKGALVGGGLHLPLRAAQSALPSDHPDEQFREHRTAPGRGNGVRGVKLRPERLEWKSGNSVLENRAKAHNKLTRNRK